MRLVYHVAHLQYRTGTGELKRLRSNAAMTDQKPHAIMINNLDELVMLSIHYTIALCHAFNKYKSQIKSIGK